MPAPFPTLLQSCRRHPPVAALVLGSGLGELAAGFAEEIAAPFSAVPGFEAPTVPGHAGRLILGSWAERRVLLFSGRLHFYEGHAWRRVFEPVALARELGARILLLTNTAGGIRDDLGPGSFLALRSHIDWTRSYPWGADDAPPPYSARLLDLLMAAAKKLAIPLKIGAYAQVPGPTYETRAEIRALRSCGADAVGMSTAREVAWAHSLGMECAAISCITNKAAGLCEGSINHEEVLTTAAAQRDRLAQLLREFLSVVS